MSSATFSHLSGQDLEKIFSELIIVLLEQPRDDDSQTVLHRACAALEALSERLTREPLLTQASIPSSLPQEDTKVLDSAEEEFSNFTWNENTASNEANVPAQRSYAHIDRAAAAVSGGPMQALEGFNKERRFSISAEPYTPSEQRRYERIVVPKDDATKSRIRRSVEHNLLFRNLDKEQLEQVIDAMFEKRIPKNVELIRQGDEGDYFYAIDSGKFQVIKDGHFVVELGPGEGFGELALMYGSPRLATVKSTEDSVVWAVDRATFRGIVIDLSFRKRRLYEGFLRSVPILQTLHDSELYRICDALQPAQYKEGQVIVSQGDPGHEFFIIEEGSAAVTIRHTDEPSSDHDVEVTRISTGDYFGELALLHDAPRAATVRALTPVKCVILSKADFIRLLGPVMPILQRNQEHYRKYEEYLAPQV